MPLDANRWSSIREYVIYQAEIESQLIKQFTNADPENLTVESLGKLPQDFVPIVLAIDPEQEPRKGGKHSKIYIDSYKNQELVKKTNFPINATRSDINGIRNAVKDLEGAGLCHEGDKPNIRRKITEKFNEAFADKGTIQGLNDLLESLPTIIVKDQEIDGVLIRGFTGEIVLLHDDNEFIVQNGMANQHQEIAKEDINPTFKEVALTLNGKGELSVDAMLRARKDISAALGLPLHLSRDDIEKVWLAQLEAGYKQWAREAKQTIAKAGVEGVYVPRFEEALRGSNVLGRLDSGRSGLGY